MITKENFLSDKDKINQEALKASLDKKKKAIANNEIIRK
jgi:hypothetical protein